jgi:ribosomal protein L11
MALSKDQAQFYQQTLEMTRKQIGDLNTQIEEELAKVKDRLAELKNAKDAAKQIYDGACKMLGIENDLEKEEEEEEEAGQ